MLKNRVFFIGSLIAVMAVSPAFSDTTATREWVKAQVYDKYIEPQGVALNTINKRLATDVRDKIYHYDTDKNSPTYRQVLDPLNTESQTAFSGINEVLQKLDGNNGEQGSAVQLETSAQNAYGAINELNNEIGDLQDQIDAKASQSDLTALQNKVNGLDGGTYSGTENMININEQNQIGLALPADVAEGSSYVYTAGSGWSELEVEDTWSPGFSSGGGN